MISSRLVSRAWMLAIGIFLSTYSLANAQNPTPDYWQCNNRIGGVWTFATAPFACDVDPFGSPEIFSEIYGPAVMDDNESRTVERRRYMQELQPVLRDLAQIYLRRRKPNVSDEEMNAWIKAWYAVAHQESFWSHYRRGPDNRLKMMRGDVGHGHGLLQVDDRWHFVAVGNGVAANLVDHAFYAMDIFYAAWERAPNQSCVPAPTEYVARTRSAWSAYNGGPSRLCRWTDAGSPHAPKDQQFYAKFQGQAWAQYIDDFRRPASIDVACLADGNDTCGETPPGSGNPDDGGTPGDGGPPGDGDDNGGAPGDGNRIPARDRLYAHEGGVCSFDGSQFECVVNLRDTACVAAKAGVNNSTILTMEPSWENAYAKRTLDRHEVCGSAGLDLYRVGSIGHTGKNINLRREPGGERLATVPTNTPLQILDFDVRNTAENPRYYRVNYKGAVGYIYAGDMRDASEWVSLSSSRDVEPQPVVLARNYGRVRAPSGINVRATPGGSRLTAVGFNRQFEVLSVEITGEENEVYYEIQVGSNRGYIYGGRLQPTDTTADWFRLSRVN